MKKVCFFESRLVKSSGQTSETLSHFRSRCCCYIRLFIIFFMPFFVAYFDLLFFITHLGILISQQETHQKSFRSYGRDHQSKFNFKTAEHQLPLLAKVCHLSLLLLIPRQKKTFLIVAFETLFQARLIAIIAPSKRMR